MKGPFWCCIVIFSIFVWVGGCVRLVLYFISCAVDWSLHISWVFLLSHIIRLVCLDSFNKVSYLQKKKNTSLFVVYLQNHMFYLQHFFLSLGSPNHEQIQRHTCILTKGVHETPSTFDTYSIIMELINYDMFWAKLQITLLKFSQSSIQSSNFDHFNSVI